MNNQDQGRKKRSTVKRRAQGRRVRFDSAISFSVGKKRVTFRVPGELKSIITHAAMELNISVAEFVRQAISFGLPRIEKGGRDEKA